MRSPGLRSRLLLLVVMALLPGLGLLVHTGIERGRDLDDSARHQVERTAELVAEHHQRLLDLARGVLVTFAHVQAVTTGSVEGCSAAAHDVLEHFPALANIGAIERTGEVFCSGVPLSQQVRASDHPYVRAAVERGELSIGGYHVSRTTGRATVNVAYPIAGAVDRGAVFGALDLQTMQRYLHELDLDPGAVVIVSDRDGVVLSRWPEPGLHVGRALDPHLTTLLIGRGPGTREIVDVDGVSRLFAVRSATLGEGEPAVFVAAGIPALAARAHAAGKLERTLLIYAVASLLAVLSALAAAELGFARPLAKIIAAARRLSSGDAEARTGLPRMHSEIGELAAAFDEMARNVGERRRLEEQLRHAQKMDAVGQLAGGIAHDFNNLLTAITTCAAFARDEVPETHPARADLDEIGAAAHRAAKLTRQLLAFSRREPMAPRRIVLGDAVRGIEKTLRRIIGEQVEMEVDARGAGVVLVDPDQVAQVLLNLVVNARDAMPGGGRVTVAVRDVEPGDPEADATLPPAPLVALAVADTGVGMDEATLSRIFEPFFTTKAPGRGTGLGLAMVYGIATQAGGAVRARSAPGRGTTITLYLPRCSAPADDEGEERRAPPNGGREAVLVVEDDDPVRAIVRRTLLRAGYAVADAARPSEAIDRLAGGPVDLLLTDVMLPEMSGPELASRLAAAHPAMRVLYMSGYTGGQLEAHRLPSAPAALLAKPFTPEALLVAVRGALDAPPRHGRSAA